MTVVRSHQHESHTGTLAVAYQPILDALSYPNIDFRAHLAEACERDTERCPVCGAEVDGGAHAPRCIALDDA